MPEDELVKGLVKGLAKELSESQIKILNLIESNNQTTKREMAERIGVTTTAVDKQIISPSQNPCKGLFFK